MHPVMTKRDVVREKLARFGALGVLLLLAALTLAGPYGLLSWGENITLLQQREARIAALRAERDELQNLVAKLDPAHVDPDLATELVRRNLNVAHPDEYVLELEQQH
jgi:cell division protein FtsB